MPVNVIYQQLTNSTFLFVDKADAVTFFDSFTVPDATAASGGCLLLRPAYAPSAVPANTPGDITSLEAAFAVVKTNLASLIVKLDQAGAIDTP